MAFTGNKRTYWAVEGLGTASEGSGADATKYTHMPGVQSVGLSVNYNLEQIFQLGQLEIYQDLEDIPDVEVTIEKVIDDTILAYTRCIDPSTADNQGAKELTAFQDNAVDVCLSIHRSATVGANPAVNNVGDGNGLNAAYMSGMFVSSVNFNFPTDGYFSESITLVGDHQKWFVPAGVFQGAPTVGAEDAGDIARRQNITFGNGAAGIANMPDPLDSLTDTDDIRIVNISVSTDLGREQMFSLGERQSYHRFVTFPVEVTCDIEAYVTDVAQMGKDALPESTNVTSNQPIKFFVTDASSGGITGAGAAQHTFDLGAYNALQSVTWNGLSTDGTNATVTYSYRNFNTLTITSTNAM
tara:strand:- start:804 stop:1868 length:1065 start_codon:yes stop_codon:yes gene_type:complete